MIVSLIYRPTSLRTTKLVVGAAAALYAVVHPFVHQFEGGSLDLAMEYIAMWVSLQD